MKSFQEFLKEKNVGSFDKENSIFQNPSSSDLVELNKTGVTFVRYLADSSDKSVYVWDAEMYIHYDGIDKLSKLGLINDATNNDLHPAFYIRFLTGTARLIEGELIHHQSDTLDYLTKNYLRPKSTWGQRARGLYGFFKKQVDILISRFSFANRYIKDCTGENSSLMKLKRAITR